MKGEETDQDDCERIIKSIMNYLVSMVVINFLIRNITVPVAVWLLKCFLFKFNNFISGVFLCKISLKQGCFFYLSGN